MAVIWKLLMRASYRLGDWCADAGDWFRDRWNRAKRRGYPFR